MEKITDSALLPANVYVAPKEERFQDTFRSGAFRTASGTFQIRGGVAKQPAEGI